METKNQGNSLLLGQYVRARRAATGLGVRALARAARVDATWISRLEHGEYVKPDPRSLARLAVGLGVDVTDLYTAAGYQPGVGLPGLVPYLRAKYDLPHEAIEQLSAHFDLINDKYHERENSHGQRDH